MITLNQAQENKFRLHEQGVRLLEVFDIEQICSNIGDFGLQGSFTYGLMIKPDIDARVYCDTPSIQEVASLATTIMAMPEVIRTMVVNYSVHPPQNGQPKGIYLGIRRLFEDIVWNFDIWIINPRDELGLEFHDLINSPLKDQLLLLKYRLGEEKLYPGSSKIPGSFSSADLYRAVVRDGASDIESLYRWRERHPGINNSI